jgi:hypothetical protein
MVSSGRLNTLSFTQEQIQGLTDKARVMDLRCMMLESMIKGLPQAVAYISPRGDILATSQRWEGEHIDEEGLRQFIQSAISGFGMDAPDKPTNPKAITQTVRLSSLNGGGQNGEKKVVITGQRWKSAHGKDLGLVLTAEDVVHWSDDTVWGNKLEQSSVEKGLYSGAQ